jgi:hypothetical protein
MAGGAPAADRFTRRRVRGLKRSVTSQEFAKLVESARARTADDHPWTFPVKVKMQRTRN